MYMIWFTSKKQEKRPAFQAEDDIIKLKTRISVLESEVLDLYTSQNNLRTKILNKIKNKKVSEEEEEQSKDLYNGILLADK